MAILFESDWKRYPAAIADYSTKNRSWVEYTVILEKLGVNNCQWPLALLNPALQGIDPHDHENLSKDIKEAIIIECQLNPWYAFREVLVVPASASSARIPFKTNRGVMSMLWSFFAGVDFALEMIRQKGKSVGGDGLDTVLTYLMAFNSTLGLFTKDDGLRKKNVEGMKKMRDKLPPYLYIPSKNDIDNQTEFSYTHRENNYITAVGNRNEEIANKKGRGFTMPVQRWDEIPFIDRVDIIYPAAAAASTAAREEAIAYNSPYGTVFTTTSGRLDTIEGKFTHDLFFSAARWHERYMDCADKSDLHNKIRDHSANGKLMAHGVYNHLQLGETDAWLNDTIKRVGATGARANMDFFNIWESSGGKLPIDPNIIKAMRDGMMDPKYVEISKEGFMLNWYVAEDRIEKHMRDHFHVVGLDTSEAIGKDRMTLIFCNIEDMSVTCTCSVSVANLYRYAIFLGNLLLKYDRTLLIPEKKSTAMVIIDYLITLFLDNKVDPFRRIFNRIFQELGSDSNEFKMISKPPNARPKSIYTTYRKWFGFNTTGKSRDELYSMSLTSVTNKSPHLLRDQQLINEIQSLEVKDNRIDHGSNSHDDMVISLLMCDWVLTHGRNLVLYGIDPLKVKTKEFKLAQEEMSEEQRLEDELQQEYQEEINYLMKALSTAQDYFVIRNLEQQLYAVSQKVTDPEGNYLSFEALKEQVRIERENRRRRGSIRSENVRASSPPARRDSGYSPLAHHPTFSTFSPPISPYLD
jgi:hypothetical protein